MAKITVIDADFNRGLNRIQAKLDEPGVFYRSVEEILLKSMRERFVSQTAPDGTPWAPLSKPYLKWKQKHNKPSAIGTLNGYLMDYLRNAGGPDRAEVGSDRPYANIFNFGGTSFAGQRAGTVKLRTDARGNLVRNKRGGAVFAGPKDRDFVHRVFATGFYESVHPARPFAGFSNADRSDIAAALNDYLQSR